jgi:hypothetical protein
MTEGIAWLLLVAGWSSDGVLMTPVGSCQHTVSGPSQPGAAVARQCGHQIR